jgi:hypothetical protein
MNIKQAIGILQIHNKWRRGCDIEPMTNTTTLGIAIDTVIEHVKNNGVSDDVIDMLPPITFLEKVNRVEVIDQKGRSYVNWKPKNKTKISLQDGGKTLKVFISN